MRWHRSLTVVQRRILLGMGMAVIFVLGLLGWSVWRTLQEIQPLSPLPMPTSAPSVLATPTPRPSATPSPTPSATPSFDTAEAGVIAAQVADARGALSRWGTPLTLVDVYDLTVSLYHRYQAKPPLPVRIRTILDALRLWAWADVRVDPIAQAQRAAALYVPETEELYLRRDWTGPRETLEAQLAYGYARAIPDQYGDLPDLMAEFSSLDRQLALAAVADGDALMSLWLYADVRPGSPKAAALTGLVEEAVLPQWRPEAPLLDDVSRLSLDLGGAFAAARYAEGGTDALDQAVLRPPRSTEQLLHPEHYAANDEPQVLTPLAPALGRGWVLTCTETVGEALMGLTLREWSHGDALPEVVDNWGGDLLQVWYGPEGRRVVLWQTAWDSASDAARFNAQMLALLPRPLLPGLIRDTTPAATLPMGHWWSGRQGEVFLRRHVDQVWLVWGTDEAAVETVAALIP